VLYVTHAHREVYALGTRVIVLDRGRVVATGAPHTVLDDPGRGVVAELSGFENLLAGSVIARRQDWGLMTVRLDGGSCTLEVPLTTTPRDQVTIAIRAGDILVASHPPAGISARNIFAGTISSMQRQGPAVVAHVDAGTSFIVHLTPASVDDLQLHSGSRVWLIIKTYSCRVTVG
jgi:molybdate transport system ATP-binding protein